MDAVVALSDFIKVIDSLDDIKRVLPDLLTIFFKLMNEVPSIVPVFDKSSIFRLKVKILSMPWKPLSINLTVKSHLMH